MKFLNSILVALVCSQTITVKNAGELLKSTKTSDGSKCQNPKLSSSTIARSGNSEFSRLRREKRQQQRNQQISDRSFGFQTNGRNYNQWQRNYQGRPNYDYQYYDNYSYNNYGYRPELNRPQYPNYPLPRNPAPRPPYRNNGPYQSQYQNPNYGYHRQQNPALRPPWRTTAYMTSTSRTTTTTTRPIRRPFIPRARPSSRPPRQPVTPTPGRTSTIRRQHHMIIPVMNGEFKSCSADTFTMQHKDQPLLPPISVKSFYMPKYGAGIQGKFDPNKNYLGIIIMAVHSNGQWYTDHSKSFRTRNFNLVQKKHYTANIKPGYILMHEFDYLNNTLVDGTNPFTDVTKHSKLLQDFTGKKLETLIREKTFYIGWGFSYQERSHSTMNH